MKLTDEFFKFLRSLHLLYQAANIAFFVVCSVLFFAALELLKFLVGRVGNPDFVSDGFILALALLSTITVSFFIEEQIIWPRFRRVYEELLQDNFEAVNK